MRTPLSQRAQEAAQSVTSERVTIAAQNVSAALTQAFSAEDAAAAQYYLLAPDHKGAPLVAARLDGMVFSEQGKGLVVFNDVDPFNEIHWRPVADLAALHRFATTAPSAATRLTGMFRQALPTPEVP